MGVILKKMKYVDFCVPKYCVSIVGAGHVGKTCLLQRLIYGGYTITHKPTVSEVYNTLYEKDLKIAANLILYDTAGSYEFPAMRQLTILKSHACIIVYSIDSLRSFKVARRYAEEVLEIAGRNFPCVLIGNKCDVTSRREVMFEAGLRCAVQYGCSYLECSAVRGVNVSELIDLVLNRIKAINIKRQKAAEDLERQRVIWKKEKKGIWTLENICKGFFVNLKNMNKHQFNKPNWREIRGNTG